MNILNTFENLSLNDKYFDISDNELDNLLFGIELVIKKTNTLNCINCKSTNLITNNIKNDIVCNDCGVVNNESIDENPDTILNENDTTSRYGPPSSILYPKSCLGTKIVGNNRLSMLQSQGQMPYKEKSLMEVCLDKIQRKCELYKITPKIIECAKILYKKVSEINHSKGKRKGKNIIMRCINRRSMIAACLFHACKIQHETRTTREIADIYDLVRYQKGIYYKAENTPFGKTKLNPAIINRDRYLEKDGVINGYETGASFLNQMGLTTQMPKYKKYATNAFKYNGCKVNKKLLVIIQKPRAKITQDNYLYLQLLDAIANKDKVTFDVFQPEKVFFNYINDKKLDFKKLVGYAKKYYNKKIVLRISEIAATGSL